jgi:hypothetical protein
MQAYEFNTTASDGFIKIPAEYKKVIPSDIRVIVIADKRKETKKDVSFPYFALDMTGYKFNREEANER